MKEEQVKKDAFDAVLGFLNLVIADKKEQKNLKTYTTDLFRILADYGYKATSIKDAEWQAMIDQFIKEIEEKHRSSTGLIAIFPKEWQALVNKHFGGKK